MRTVSKSILAMTICACATLLWSAIEPRRSTAGSAIAPPPAKTSPDDTLDRTMIVAQPSRPRRSIRGRAVPQPLSVADAPCEHSEDHAASSRQSLEELRRELSAEFWKLLDQSATLEFSYGHFETYVGGAGAQRHGSDVIYSVSKTPGGRYTRACLSEASYPELYALRSKLQTLDDYLDR